MIEVIHQLMERETAGDPVSGLKWTRKTTAKIARQLKRLGIVVSRNTVGRLLRQMRYSLRTNRKKIATTSSSDRDRQFRYLDRQRDQFEKRGDPVVSVDAKTREISGNSGQNPMVFNRRLRWSFWFNDSRPPPRRGADGFPAPRRVTETMGP